MPGIRDVTPEQNAAARALCRRELEGAVRVCAAQLSDQPLSIKALMARLLIEDFAALDVKATGAWLRANETENHGHAGGYPDTVEWARERRGDALTRLAQAQIAKGEHA